MAEYTEDELYAMDDDELEAAFKAAKAEAASIEEHTEEDISTIDEESVVEEEEFEETTEEEDTDESQDEEETESDLEQPDEDSDHDTSTDAGEVDDATKASTEADSKPDEDTEAEDEQTEVEEETKAEEVQQVQQYTFKANGREYEFTQDEIMEQFPKIFGQAMDYTKKMQAIKPYRKTIDAIEQAGLTHDDINLAIDVLKGDKDAISEVIKRKGIDTLDLDTENSNYVAKDYGRDGNALEIKDIIDTISKDAEYSTTQNILGSQWDEASWNAMSEDPQMIALLHEDVKSGMYDTLQPIVDKIKVIDGGNKSDLEYYGMAAQEYYQKVAQEQERETLAQQQKTEAENNRLAELQAQLEAAEKRAKELEQEKLAAAKEQASAREATKKASAKRKAAAPTKSAAGKRDVIDYLDDSDEAYEEWYAKLQSKM